MNKVYHYTYAFINRLQARERLFHTSSKQ